MFERWAACGISTSFAPGMFCWISRAIAGGVPGSFSPHTTRVGVLISFSLEVTLIFGIAAQQPA
jgi:hypothetical protein